MQGQLSPIPFLRQLKPIIIYKKIVGSFFLRLIANLSFYSNRTENIKGLLIKCLNVFNLKVGLKVIKKKSLPFSISVFIFFIAIAPWESFAAGPTTLTIANPSTAVTAANVCPSSLKVPIHAFTISANGTNGTGTLTNFKFTTTGTYAASNITNFKIWFNSTNSLASATLLATNSSPALAGTQTFTAFSQAISGGSTEFYWITMDVASLVTNGNTITVSGSASTDMTTTLIKAGSTTNASGTQTLKTNATINLSSAAGTDVQTKCINTAITNITYAIVGTGTGASITAGALPAGVSSSFSGGIYTISGTPTASGVFNYTVSTSGSACINPSLSGTITVNANGTINLSSAAGTDAQTKCINTTITNITYAIGGTGTGASITAGALPSGVTGSYSAGFFTISGTPTASGVFNYTVGTSGSACINPSLSGIITVNANGTINLSSAAGTDAQTKCINNAITNITYAIGGTGTGTSITAGALPAGVSGSFNGGIYTISGTPTASGVFNYTVGTSGSACINPSLSGTITVNADATINLTSGNNIQTLCTNTATASITYAIGGGGTGAGVSGLPPGVSGTYNGATKVFTINGTPTTSGTYNYTVTTTGSSCINPFLSGTITVNALPAITVQPSISTQAICLNGAAIALSVTATAGSGSISGYQWYKNASSSNIGGTLIGGATASSYTPLTTVTGVLYYYCIITNTNGCVITSNVSGSITINALPAISVQPSTSTQTLCVNVSAAAMSVTATAGSGSISGYQWYSNTSASNIGGTLLSGANTPSYSPSTAAAGVLYYYCIITNTNGCTVTSNVSGSVTVYVLPAISVQPSTSTQNICLNGSATALTVTATAGSGSISSYQWYKNVSASNIGGTLITGATASSYTPLTTVAGVLYYYCIVTNTNGCAVTSNVSGSVTVNALPSITVQPSTSTQTLCLNTTALGISVTAAGSGLTYQWYNNIIASNIGGILLSGATSSVYTPLTSSTGTLYYYCVVSGTCSPSVTSNVSGAVIINALPSITVQPSTSTQSVCLNGSPTLLSVIATAGSGSISGYQWYKSASALNTGGTLIVGATTLSYTPLATVTGVLYYYCIITNTNGCTVTSNVSGSAIVNALPSITVQPLTSTQNICLNTSATALSVSAVAGSGSISGYQWYSNTSASNAGGILLVGATSSAYTPLTSAIGILYYYCIITNTNGCSVTSNVSGAVIIITTPLPPSLITGSITVCAGSSGNNYSVAAVSGANSYSWSYTGTGATITNGSANTVLIAFSSFATSGTLSVTAINTCGSSAPSVIALSVDEITGQPSNNISNPGGTPVTFSVNTLGTITNYQWQFSPNGSTGWINVINATPVGITYTNSSSALLTVTPGIATVFGLYYYRCIVTTPSCTLTSNNAVLTISDVNDQCVNAIPLSINSSTVLGSLINSTFNSPFGANDVWYKITSSCTISHTITVSGFSGSGGNIDWELYTGSGCPASATYYDHSNTASDPETESVNLISGTTYYIRVLAFNAAANNSNFNISVNSTTPTFTLNNNGTLPAGNILVNTSNVTLLSFELTPVGCSSTFNFTGLAITTSGTANAADIGKFRIIYDVNSNGIKDSSEGTVSGIGIAWSSTLNFSITGQTSLTGSNRYLLVADVTLGATNNRTITANLSAANVTAGVIVTGTAAGNLQTIKSPLVTITAVHPAAGTIDQNTAGNIIASFQLDALYNVVVPTGITITTAGTYISSTDITQFRLYQNNSNNGISPTLIGNITASGSSPQTLTFTGTGYPILPGNTQYLLLTVDVPLSGTDLNTVSITATPIANFSFTGQYGESVVKSGVDPATIGPAKTINGPRVNIQQVHPAAGNITQGTTNNQIATYQLNVTNLSTGFVNIQSVNLKTAGTYIAGDITSFSLWQNSANTLTGAALVGTVAASAFASGQTISFNSGFTSIANAGYSYLMVTANVYSVATLTKTLWITSTDFTNFSVLSSWGSKVAKLGANPAPASNTQTIVGPIAALTVANPIAGNMLVGSTDNLLTAVKVIVSNADILPTSIKFTTSSGTYSGSTDVFNFKLYQNDANSLTGATLVASIVATASASQTLIYTTGFIAIPSGTTGYLLLCADLTGSATSSKTVSILATPFSNFSFTSTGPVVVTGTSPLSASNSQTIVPKLDVYSSGTKNWDNTTPNWGQNTNGAGGGYANSVWIANGDGQFEGTPGQVTITAPVVADTLKPIVTNYKFDASTSSNGVTLASRAIINVPTGIAYVGNTSTNPVLYGVNGFTKTGIGELQLGSDLATTFSGTVFGYGGTITWGKKAGGYEPINTLNNNPVELNNARLTIAATTGANASVQNFTSLATTGYDTIGLYRSSATSNVYLNVTPTTNTLAFGTTNGVPLTISGGLKVDNGGSANTIGDFATATNQNFIAFGDVVYTGNTTFEAYAKNASLKKRTGDMININLGGWGHYITGVNTASGRIDDNGYITTFLGGGGVATDGGAISLNAAASTMTGDWVIGDAVGVNAAWVVTNTSTCLTIGSITINNYSKLNLQLSTPGNSTITYSPRVINVYGLGPYSKTNSYTFGSALDFYDFARASDTITLPTNVALFPVTNSKLAAIGVMIGDDSTSSSTGLLAAFQLNGTLTGTGGLEKTGPGILILNAQNGSGYYNSYSDSTRVIRGTLSVNSGSNLGTGPVHMYQITKNNTVLNFYNAAQTIGSLTSQWSDNSGQSQIVSINGTTLTINQNTSTTFGNGTGTSVGYIKGTGNIIKDGTGTLTLTGANTYTGLTQVKGGVLELKNTAANTLPATNDLDIIGGTLLASVNQTLNNVTLSTGNLTLAANVTLTINGVFTMATTSSNITLGTNAKIVYGANTTLVYAGNTQQQTSVNTKELPTTNPPKNITFSNYSAAGVKWSAAMSLTGTATVNGWVDMNGQTIGGTGSSFVLNGLFGGPLSAKTFSGSSIIYNVNTNNIRIGMEVTGNGIPANTTIIYIDPLVTKTATISTNATTTAISNLTFGYRGGLIVTLPGGIDAHVQTPSSKIYNSGANYIFNTPTSGSQIYPAFPTVGTLSQSPAWNVTISAGVGNKVIMGTNSNLAIDNNLALTSGVYATGKNLLTFNNIGGALTAPNIPFSYNTDSSVVKASFIALCDVSNNPITDTSGNYGFRVNNVGTTETWFPVGYNMTGTPNRMTLQNYGTKDNYTVVLAKGNIGNVPKSVVERIWHVKESVAGGSQVTMKLFFIKQDMTKYGISQDEVEYGFDYGDMHLIHKIGALFQNNANGTDVLTRISGYSYGTELYGLYTRGVSTDNDHVANGITSFSPFSIANAYNIILPATLVNLKAYQVDNIIKIDFTSLTENNVAYYEVRRSANAVDFTAFDTLSAAGNGTERKDYTLPDLHPLKGNNYYQVRAVDKDGKFIYSNVVMVNIHDGKSGITVYPNPLKGKVATLQFNNMEAGDYTVILFNANGTKLYQRILTHAGSTAAYQISLPQTFANGLYQLSISSNKTKVIKSILIE